MEEAEVLKLLPPMVSFAIGAVQGTVTTPAEAGGNLLHDSTKHWAVDAHKSRLVRVTNPDGTEQVGVISTNAESTLLVHAPWYRDIPAGATYSVLAVHDVARILRDVLGAGSDIDIPTEFDELKDALSAALEASIDTGTATGGSNTTIVDTGKSWAVNMWVDATFEVLIGATRYLGLVISNTVDTITFAALAGGAVVVAGCEYALKRPVDIADITDRAARLLGVIYGSQGQQLLQRAVTFELLVQLRNAGVEVSPATETTLVKTVPIAKAAIFNTALPAADNDILGAVIAPTNSPSWLRIYITVAVAGVLYLRRTVGGVTVSENLNNGVNLVANSAYCFGSIEWRTGDSLNLRYSATGGNILALRIDEIGAAE